MDIAVFGLGRVGLPLAASLSASGHRVIGVDIDQMIVDAINSRTVQSEEPGVAERIARTPSWGLKATTDGVAAVAGTDLSFIVVPTPSNTLGGYSLRYVIQACEGIGAGIRAKGAYHAVALVSTVLPGSSERTIIPCLERFSGQKVGQGFGYCYNPALIALGEVVKGFEGPDCILIGEHDAVAGDMVLKAHQTMVVNQCPVARLQPVEAEICKLASNTHETMRVSFANMLLAVCSEIPRTNVDRITDALAHRMGHRFFKGAVPFGGPCWPRDNRALSTFMEAIGTPNEMPRHVDLFNDAHGRYVLQKVLALSKAGDLVGIMGLAYKPGTDVIERSFAVDLARWLVAERRRVIGWDPLAMSNVRNELGDAIGYAGSPEECLRESAVVVLTNPLKEFEKIDWLAGRNATVIDGWRCLSLEAQERVGRCLPLGVGPDEERLKWLERVLGAKLDLLTH